MYYYKIIIAIIKIKIPWVYQVLKAHCFPG